MPLIRKGLSFEMPGRFEIMRAVQKGLNPHFQFDV